MKRKHFIATVIIAVAIMLAGGAIIYADLINSIDNDVNLEVIVEDTEFGINAAPPSDNMNGGTRPPTTTARPPATQPPTTLPHPIDVPCNIFCCFGCFWSFWSCNSCSW